MKEQIIKHFISHFKTVNSGLCVLYCRPVVLNRKWQIVGRFFFLIELKEFFIL